MSCDRSCFDKQHVNFGYENCSTCNGRDDGKIHPHKSMELDDKCWEESGKCGVGGYCKICKFSIDAQEQDWNDKNDEWTKQIQEAHPLNTGFFDTYSLACQMVGNRHSKFALVALVNWLLRKAQDK